MYEEVTMFDVQIDADVVIASRFESVPDSDMTMYQVAKIVNDVLKSLNVQKNEENYTVRPQMIYNYNRNKMIVKGRTVEKVTRNEAFEFVTRFIKRVSK